MATTSTKTKRLSSRRDAFWRGFLRVYDICGSMTEYKVPREEIKTDEEAIREDWEHVGEYMRYAMEVVNKDGRQEATLAN